MANTALSAQAGNAKETHMVFRNKEHEQFYHRLMREGIDPSVFEFMDDDERRAAMRRAGIDTDDFEDF